MNVPDKNNLHGQPENIWNMDESWMALEHRPATSGL